MADEDVASVTDETGLTRGLYSGYESYRTPTDDDYRALMTRGIVILDTNALLNLYRYTADIRTALLEVLRRLQPQLWEPAHVIWEFWRNRESAIRDYSGAAKQFEAKIEDARGQAITAVRALANRIGWSEAHKKGFVEPIDDVFNKLSIEVKRVMDLGGPDEARRNTSEDPVLRSLEPVLLGRVGSPLDPKAHDAAVKEAQRRINNEVPPGYKDGKKANWNAEGDYLVWVQIMIEAASRKRDVLLVTGDIKEDWWREWGGNSAAGPRYELLEEFTAETSRRLFMLKPADFLQKAATVFNVDVNNESVERARRLDERVIPNYSYSREYVDRVDIALRHAATLWGLIIRSQVRLDDRRFDYEIEQSGHRFAVEVRQRIRNISDIDHVVAVAARAKAAGYDGILVMASTDEPTVLQTIASSIDFGLAFVKWNSMEDVHLIYAALQHLVAQSPQHGAPGLDT